MRSDQQALAEQLGQWETHLRSFTLPQWEELPDFGLYMEQVIVLLGQYLRALPGEERESAPITAAAINNYVRTRVMPKPIKKKYYRVHIAYLVIICTLKQSLSIAMLQRMLPLEMSEAEIRAMYGDYVRRHTAAQRYFLEQVSQAVAAAQRVNEGQEPPRLADLVCMFASISGFSRTLAEKLLLLSTADAPEAKEESSP